MKISTLTLSLCILLSFGMLFQVNAQRFTLSPSGTVDETYAINDYASHQIDIINNTSDVITFKWRTVSNTFDPGWSLSLCDLGGCYPTPPDSNVMNPTTPGGDALFICHAGFSGIPGHGVLTLFVYEDGDEANGDTVRWIYTAGAVGMEEDFTQGPEIQIFPNPATDFVQIRFADNQEQVTVEVFDLFGKSVVRESNIQSASHRIPVSGFLPGTYYLRVSDREGNHSIRTFMILD